MSIFLIIIAFIIIKCLLLTKILLLKYYCKIFYYFDKGFIDKLSFYKDQYLLNLVNCFIFALKYASGNSFKVIV